MTAKEYLRQAIELKLDIERKQEQIIKLRAMAERTTSSYQALRMSGTTNHSKLEDAVVKMSIISDELGKDMERYAEKYREISMVIDAVDDPVYKQLLSLRYLSVLTWEEIAVKMHYSWRHVHRVHSEALNHVIVCHIKK